MRGWPAPQAERGKDGAGDEAAGRSAWPPWPSDCTPCQGWPWSAPPAIITSSALPFLAVTESFTSLLLQTSHVGLLYHGTIPDYGQERETRQDGRRRVTRG